MPITLNGVASFVSSIAAPATGEAASQSSLSTPFQSLINNCKYLYDLVTTGGVTAVRTVSTIGALQALTGMADGQICVVRKQGVFIYTDPDSTAESLPWVVTPLSGTGRWFHILESVKGSAGVGLASLVGGQVPQSQLTNQIVNFQRVTATTIVNVAGSTWVDLPVTGSYPTFTDIRENDIIVINGDVQCTVSSNGTVVSGWFARAMYGSTAGPQQTKHAVIGTASNPNTASMPFTNSYVCSASDEAAGTMQVKVQVQRNFGDATYDFFLAGVTHMMQVRP